MDSPKCNYGCRREWRDFYFPDPYPFPQGFPVPSSSNCDSTCQEAWLGYIEQEMTWLTNTSRPYDDGDPNRGMKREEKAMYDDLAQKRNDIRASAGSGGSQSNSADPLAGTIFDAAPGQDPLAGTIFDVGGGSGASAPPRSTAPKSEPAQPAPLDDIGDWDFENPFGLDLGEGGAAGGRDFEDWLLHLLAN